MRALHFVFRLERGRSLSTLVESCVPTLYYLRGTTINRAYGGRKKLYIWLLFTNNVWSCLLWSPPVTGALDGRRCVVSEWSMRVVYVVSCLLAKCAEGFQWQ